MVIHDPVVLAFLYKYTELDSLASNLSPPSANQFVHTLQYSGAACIKHLLQDNLVLAEKFNITIGSNRLENSM